jgi:hypothetical protein
MSAQITFFQGASGHNGGTSGQVVTACSAFGSNSRQGDLIIVGYSFWRSGGGQTMPSSIYDSLSTTYYPFFASPAFASSYVNLWWGICPSSGANTVHTTVSGAGTVSTCMVAMEFGIPPNVGLLGFNDVTTTNATLSITSLGIQLPIIQGAFNTGTETMKVASLYDETNSSTLTNSGLTGITQANETTEGTSFGIGYADSVGTVTNGSTVSTTWSVGGTSSLLTIFALTALTPPSGTGWPVGYCFVL